VETEVTSPNLPSSRPSLWSNIRLAAAILLLIPAVWFTYQTINGLAARRLIRTDLAELQHARYGILSADQWRGIIGPILNAQVDKLDLKGQSKSLRPMVEQSLYALLDNIKTQMTAPPKPSTTPPSAKPSNTPSSTKPAPNIPVSPMLVNMIVAALRPHVPEYTTVVMAELAKPQTSKTFQDSIRSVLNDAVRDTFGTTDMSTYNAILHHYGCPTGPACEIILANQVQAADAQLNHDYLIVLASAALAFILLMLGQPALSRPAVIVLMLFSIAMLVGGVLSPMLEVEVRLTKVDATLLGTPIEFQNQSLYYRSKTVFEVFQNLIQMHRPEMTLVAVLVILFSVVFPLLKMLALSVGLFRPALLRTSRLLRLLAFDLAKWSMADVMALAIFMSFVAFNGVIGSSLDALRDMPNITQVLIPTNASRILPGYYLFIGFCLSSILLSQKLHKGLTSASTRLATMQ
jgi:hypothetical protein